MYHSSVYLGDLISCLTVFPKSDSPLFFLFHRYSISQSVYNSYCSKLRQWWHGLLDAAGVQHSHAGPNERIAETVSKEGPCR